MTKLENIFLPSVFILIVIFCIVWMGSFIPFGEEHTMTGYLSDFSHQTGYGYSGTTLVIDNMTYNFNLRYQKSIPINQNVIVTYANTILGNEARIIIDIEAI